ncbi:MAG: type II secretion system protein [Bdellovibrionota bacterium]
MTKSTLLRHKAFTLIELMVVISIIGILAATSVPYFSKYRKKAMTAGAMVVIGTIRNMSLTLYYDQGYFLGASSSTGATLAQYNDWSNGNGIEFQAGEYISSFGMSPLPQGTRTQFLYFTYAAEYDATGTIISAGKPNSISYNATTNPLMSGDASCLSGGGGGTLSASDMGAEANPTGVYHYTTIHATANLAKSSGFLAILSDPTNICTYLMQTIVVNPPVTGDSILMTPIVTYSLDVND